MYTPLYEESLKLKMKFTELYLCLQIIQTHTQMVRYILFLQIQLEIFWDLWHNKM